MKNLILKSFVAFAVVLSSCSEDEVKKKFDGETPLNAYMKTVAAESVEEYSDGELYSIGYTFKTKKAGSIIALGVSAPQAGTYTVSLYDAETSTLLGTTEVTLTEAQVTAKPYGFQYHALANPVSAEVDQTFHVVYDTNSGDEEFYRPSVANEVFQLENSFIEFQEGFYGSLGSAPDQSAGTTFYTADIKIKYN